MLSSKEKARSIVEQLDVKNNSQWHFKTAGSNCEKWFGIITNTPDGEAINRFAKSAILDFLRTTIVTNCPEKWQPKRVNLTILEAADWINLVPLKESYLDKAIDEIKRRNDNNDGYLTLVSIANAAPGAQIVVLRDDWQATSASHSARSACCPKGCACAYQENVGRQLYELLEK